MDVLLYILGFFLVGAVIVVVLIWWLMRRARWEIRCTRLYPSRVIRIEVKGDYPTEKVVESVLEMLPKFGKIDDVIVVNDEYREAILKALREKRLLN